jgi:alpha-L-fucosidase
MKWWTESRFGLSLHWGLYSVLGRGEWVRSVERLTVEQYRPCFEQFSPAPDFAKRWARLARESGATHVVLTTKHHDGFCLFDSNLTDYTSVRAPSCRRDLVREYVDALRAEGLRVGLYYSLVDWHHPDAGPVFGDRQHPLRHDPAQQSLDPKRDWSRYVRYLHGQVEELLTNYGTIDLLVFDFSYWDFRGERWGAAELMRTVRRLQPDVIVNDRLGFEPIKQWPRPEYAGDFDHSEQDVPREPVRNAGGDAIPWESWISLGNSWCHSAAGDPHLKSAKTIVRTLVNCVSKGGNFCVNLAPDASGAIDESQASIMREVGAWLARNGESIRGCVAAPLPKPEWGRWTQSADGSRLYAHFLDQPIGHACLPGLRGVVANPHCLATRGPIELSDYWNPGVQTFDGPDDIFLNWRTPVMCTWPLPDDIDTVVRFDVAKDARERDSARTALADAHEVALRRVPFA